jgi:hypothetical protein
LDRFNPFRDPSKARGAPSVLRPKVGGSPSFEWLKTWLAPLLHPGSQGRTCLLRMEGRTLGITPNYHHLHWTQDMKHQCMPTNPPPNSASGSTASANPGRAASPPTLACAARCACSPPNSASGSTASADPGGQRRHLRSRAPHDAHALRRTAPPLDSQREPRRASDATYARVRRTIRPLFARIAPARLRSRAPNDAHAHADQAPPGSTGQRRPALVACALGSARQRRTATHPLRVGVPADSPREARHPQGRRKASKAHQPDRPRGGPSTALRS